MRLSQPQGLPIKAMDFLGKNAVKVNQCPHCHRHDVGYQRKVIGMYGMYDEIELYQYTLKDGSIAYEYIQDTVWISGPIIWLALKWKSINFVWSGFNIQHYLKKH